MTKPSVLLALLCAACVAEVGGVPAPPEPSEPEAVQTCDDPRYGDGVCNTDLACEVPDIDCFRTFADDATAALWFAEREARKADAEGRPPRTLIAPSDPRFVELRALLDAGWQAFSKHRPVGRLVEHRLALVMIEDPSVNAFVTAESLTQREVFCVMVHTGLQAAPLAEDGRLGILLHEMQHIVGTHGLPGVDDDMRIHYVAGSSEPIGRLQTDDPVVHEAIEGWMNMAEDVGPYSASQLGGFPYKGVLWDLLDMLVDDGMQIDEASCRNAAMLIGRLRGDLAASRDPLDDALTIELSTVVSRASLALRALRDECMRGVTLTFVRALAKMFEETEQEIAESMTARDLQLVTGKHVVDALDALTRDRRDRMRALEGSLPQNRPWSSARYFSDEEDADDIAVMVLKAIGRDPESYAAAAVSSVAKRGAAAAASCQSMLDAGVVPEYGVDLLDTHHASCWRAYHTRQIAKLETSKPRRTRAPRVVLPESLVGLPSPPAPELVIHE